MENLPTYTSFLFILTTFLTVWLFRSAEYRVALFSFYLVALLYSAGGIVCAFGGVEGVGEEETLKLQSS